MFKINLEKKLEKTRRVREDFSKGNVVITQTQKLIDDGFSRDLDLLRGLSNQSSLARSEHLKGEQLELEKHERFYNGAIFDESEIEELAVKYRLKFLSSSLFIGHFDTGIISDMRHLEDSISKSTIEDQAKKRGVSVEEYKNSEFTTKWKLDNSELKTKFFILAPAKCFKLTEEKFAKFELPKIETDPVMFYSIGDNKFRLVRKWGKDFTIGRRILGFITENESRFRTWFYGSIIGIPLATILYFWHGWAINNWVAHVRSDDNTWMTTTQLFWFSTVILSVIALLVCSLSGTFNMRFFGKEYTKYEGKFFI